MNKRTILYGTLGALGLAGAGTAAYNFRNYIQGLINNSGQTAQATTQAQPAVRYTDKVVTAGRGYTNLGTVLSHYFRASSLNELARKTERYNGLQPNARLQKDQEIRIVIDHGNRREVAVYKAQRNGERVYSVVNRALVEQNNLVARARANNTGKNNLANDTMAVVKASDLERLGIDPLNALAELGNGLVLVSMADGILGDDVRLGQ